MLNPDKVIDNQAHFELDLSDPGALPEEAIESAISLMRTGRLHRYGEYSGTEPHAALFEREYADYVGSKYAVGVNSGGCAIFLGLKVAGVEPGDKVLVNAFNLAPVPGAITHAGAKTVLVEVDEDHRISLDDLALKAKTSGAKALLLTHMRGHIADMNAISAICKENNLALVEDCAHTMGAGWKGKFTGLFGDVGCFSTQTFKHINSGEGGILVTDDDDMAAKAILYSGSYMLYGQHQSSPPQEVFDRHKKHIPNFSMRMSNLVACILRPQLKQMFDRGERWNHLYNELATRLNQIEHVEVLSREESEQFVASSIQFHIRDMSSEHIQLVSERCTERGVAIKWFGRGEPMGYTSQYHDWQYLEKQNLPNTDTVLSTTCDMRIPLSLTQSGCDQIAAIIQQEVSALTS
ncbi:MAG: aminotransferase class I/II-fold pyridoxal phosphate-dependent enzyme [Granulosicoccus sp.]|nr:aminotransferase class I/II-fold pyridoxal phosphate-dependent enzyme [Granulosicoccus sp.]